MGRVLKIIVGKLFFHTSEVVKFDYSKIRLRREQLKGFGGVSSGPDPLEEVHNDIRKVLDNNGGQPITITTIVDIMNLIGKCVVVMFVEPEIYLETHIRRILRLKELQSKSTRDQYGWTSNNSVFAELGMDYTEVSKKNRR